MHSESPSLVSPSPMAQLLKQLALDDLPPTSKDSLDPRTLTEEPESLGSSPTGIDFPSLTGSRESTLTDESTASSSRTSREGSCIIPADPTRNASITSIETLPIPPVPQYDPIKTYPRPLHLSASSPALKKSTSILRTSSYTDQSVATSTNPPSPPSPPSPGVPSVKFAPLPEIDRPKKRKRNVTLGVAARSQMLAHRRQVMRENEDLDHPPKQLWRSDDDDDEDPLVALGHMVKLASIGIWRKVSLKDRKARPVMQERSNSDSMLEITRQAARVGGVLVDGPTEDLDGEPSWPQPETIAKAADDGVVAIQPRAVPATLVPTKE